MIIDALLAAEPYLRIAERVFDPEKFILLNDSILNTIESSTATVESGHFLSPSLSGFTLIDESVFFFV